MLWLSINIIALFQPTRFRYLHSIYLIALSGGRKLLRKDEFRLSFHGTRRRFGTFFLVVISISAVTEAIRRYLESWTNHHKKLMTLKMFLSLDWDARERSHSFNYIAKRIQNTRVNLFAKINFDFCGLIWLLLLANVDGLLFFTFFIRKSAARNGPKTMNYCVPLEA